jgi:hypothetical protein
MSSTRIVIIPALGGSRIGRTIHDISAVISEDTHVQLLRDRRDGIPEVTQAVTKLALRVYEACALGTMDEVFSFDAKLGVWAQWIFEVRRNS